MAGEIVAELIAAVGEVALRAALSGPIREWRLDSFYKGLDADKKTAMLEIVAAAIVRDGHLSDFEKAWLEARRESDRDDAGRVDAAVDVATKALAGAGDDGYRDFVAARAKAFSEEDDRERILKAVFVVLRAGMASSATRGIFGDGLGIAEAKQSVIQSKLDHLLS